jgi:hypothetical protein
MSLPLTYDSADPMAKWDGPYSWDSTIILNTGVVMPDLKVTYPVADVLGFSQGITDMVTGYMKGVSPQF